MASPKKRKNSGNDVLSFFIAAAAAMTSPGCRGRLAVSRTQRGTTTRRHLCNKSFEQFARLIESSLVGMERKSQDDCQRA